MIKIQQKFNISRVIMLLITFYVLAIAIFYMYSLICNNLNRSKETILKNNIYSIIYKSLEKYAFINDGFYPLSIDILTKKGILDELPYNPFDKKRKPMEDVIFNDKNKEGNFTYVPIIKDNKVIGFYLIVYSGIMKRIVDGNDVMILDLDKQDVDYDGDRDDIIIPSNNEIFDVDKDGKADRITMIIRSFNKTVDFNDIPKLSYLLKSIHYL